MAITFNKHYTHAYLNSLVKKETNPDDSLLNETEWEWVPLRLPLAEMMTAFEITDKDESGFSGTNVYMNNGFSFFVAESRKELEEAQDTIMDKALFIEEPGFDSSETSLLSKNR